MNWFKQTRQESLFPDISWSRPENRARAGKLLIIGGHVGNFSAVARAYNAASQAGIGTIRIILPDSLKKNVGGFFEDMVFAPSTPSGSFSRQALAEVQPDADWADAVLLAGDFGRNSETAVFLESLVRYYQGKLAIAHDGADYFLTQANPLLARADTLLAANLGKLQKLASSSFDRAIRHGMSLHQAVEIIGEWSEITPVYFMTKHDGYILFAAGGKVSTTPESEESWQIDLAPWALVWWLQQPQKSFETITAAIFDYINKG